MRVLLLAMVICSWVTAAEAKTIKVPKGGVDVNQLHDELLSRFPSWRGTQQPDGMYTNPLLYVESDDEEIALTVPETANDAAVQSVVAAHVPRPDEEDQRDLLRAKKPSTLSLPERVARLEALLDLD